MLDKRDCMLCTRVVGRILSENTSTVSSTLRQGVIDCTLTSFVHKDAARSGTKGTPVRLLCAFPASCASCRPARACTGR